MGILHWIGHVFTSSVSKVEDLVRLVRNGLSGLWHILTGLGHNVAKAWRRFARGVEWLARYLDDFALAVYHRARHIITVVIPHAIRGAITTAATYARRIAGDVKAWAVGAVNYLRAHLLQLLGDLRQWAKDAVTWLTGHLAQVAADLSRTMRRVWSLLDDPKHLAAWAIGAIVGAFITWAQANAVQVGRWVMRNGVHLVLDEAATVEDWLTRII